MIKDIETQSKRLTEEGFTIKQIYRASYQYYKSKDGDDKDIRMRLDIVNAKVTARKKLDYDISSKKWEQTGRDIKIEFICNSKPISYKKTDTIAVHKFPVTFIIHNLEKGVDSTFKWRTGSLKKPKFTKVGMDKAQRTAIANYNIKNGIQLQFFFDLMWVLRKNNLLYGTNFAKWAPTKTNPKFKIFFDKHALFIFKRILFKLLTSNKELLKTQLDKK